MKILIVGATSAIAVETARCFARDAPASFLLAGRSDERLAAVAADLRARGAAAAELWTGDLTDPAIPSAVIALAFQKLGASTWSS